MAKKMKRGAARKQSKNEPSSPPLDAINSESDSASDCPPLGAISDAILGCVSMAEDTPLKSPSEVSQGEACADEAPSEEAPSAQAPPDEAPPEEAPSDEVPPDEASSDKALAEEMPLDEDNRPETSPYTTPIYTLSVGPNGTPYTVPQHFLRQSPNLLASMENAYRTCNNISLPELDESIGHTLVHYLHTGTYQTLKLPGVLGAAAKTEEYRRGILAYFAARSYGLDGLVAHAKEAIVKFESPMTIFEILDIVKELYPKSIDDDEVWFSDHLKVNIADAFYEDATLFTQERFLRYVGGAAAFDRTLFKSVAEICTEKITRMERKEEPAAEEKPAEDQCLLATVGPEPALYKDPAAVEEPTADELYPGDPAPEDPPAEECPCEEPVESAEPAPEKCLCEELVLILEECPYEEPAEPPECPAEGYQCEEPSECPADDYLCEEPAEYPAKDYSYEGPVEPAEPAEPDSEEDCPCEELTECPAEDYPYEEPAKPASEEDCPCEEFTKCPADDYPYEELAEPAEPASEEDCPREELTECPAEDYPYEELAEPASEEDCPCKEPAPEPESVAAEPEPTANPWSFWGLPHKSKKNGARQTFEGRLPSPPAEPQSTDEPDVEENSMCPSGTAHFKNDMWRGCNRCRAFVRHMFAQLASEGELDMVRYEFVDKMLLN